MVKRRLHIIRCKANVAIERTTIANTDHLPKLWAQTEISDGLNGVDVEFINLSANDGELGVVSVQLTTAKWSCEIGLEMDKEKNASEIRNEILGKYYSEIYQSYLFQQDAQGIGIRYFERSLERFWGKRIPQKVLEIGGGSGEHIPYIRYVPKISYTSVDIRDKFNDTHISKLSEELVNKLEFVVGDAQELPFPDASFDRVFSTCLLHHVDDVLAVLLEARRVTAKGGEIAFIIPTDPGILNQLIKRVISYPKLRKLTEIRPELFYALDHKNHVGSILELIKFVFLQDQLELHYRPFRIRSWNLNLLVVAKIVKK